MLVIPRQLKHFRDCNVIELSGQFLLLFCFVKFYLFALIMLFKLVHDIETHILTSFNANSNWKYFLRKKNDA